MTRRSPTPSPPPKHQDAGPRPRRVVAPSGRTSAAGDHAVAANMVPRPGDVGKAGPVGPGRIRGSPAGARISETRSPPLRGLPCSTRHIFGRTYVGTTISPPTIGGCRRGNKVDQACEMAPRGRGVPPVRRVPPNPGQNRSPGARHNVLPAGFHPRSSLLGRRRERARRGRHLSRDPAGSRDGRSLTDILTLPCMQSRTDGRPKLLRARCRPPVPKGI